MINILNINRNDEYVFKVSNQELNKINNYKYVRRKI